DYVTKPSGEGGVAPALARVRDDLLPKIKALVPAAGGGEPALRSERRAMAPSARRSGGPVSVVAIGVSTGGPAALAELLPALPPTLAAPVLIVQHMPPQFTRLLAERLDASCQLRVGEAKPGEPIVRGQALMAPGDFHLAVERAAARV